MSLEQPEMYFFIWIFYYHGLHIIVKLMLTGCFYNFAFFLLKKKIQNWLVVGRAWQICLHYRQMGFNHLKNIVDDNTNFFIAPWGCLDEYNQLITTKHIQSDNLKWSKVSDELWQLIK